MNDIFEELHKARHEIRRIHRLLYELIILPDIFDKELAMAALDELKALGARIDAVTALLPTDIATAVAAQAAADQAAITTAQNALAALQAQNATDEAALEAEITTLTGQVAALEKAAGVPPPAIAVSPTSINGTAGQAVSQVLAVTGGTAPYAFASSLPDVTVDGSGNVAGTPAAAESGSITVTDSSSPPLTATVAVTIAAAASALTVSPPSISSAVGAAIAVTLVASGGTPPYTVASNLADVTVDASGNVAGTPAAAETGAITVTDSSTPPQTADVAVTIA